MTTTTQPESGTPESGTPTPSNQKEDRRVSKLRINVLILFGTAFIFLYLIFCALDGATTKAAFEAFTLMKELMIVLVTGVVAVAKDLVD